MQQDSHWLPSDADMSELVGRIARHTHLCEEGEISGLEDVRRYAIDLSHLPKLIKAGLLFRQYHIMGVGGICALFGAFAVAIDDCSWKQNNGGAGAAQ